MFTGRDKHIFSPKSMFLVQYLTEQSNSRMQYTESLIQCTGGNRTCLKHTLLPCRTDLLHSHRLSSSNSPPSTEKHPHTNSCRRWQRSGPLKKSSWCKTFQLPPKKYLNMCRSCIIYVYVWLLTTAYKEKKIYKTLRHFSEYLLLSWSLRYSM